jgi:hypothetical protein
LPIIPLTKCGSPPTNKNPITKPKIMTLVI